ncbi:MAG: DUF3177 family protein [Xenococcaceae cyanobacterium]
MNEIALRSLVWTDYRLAILITVIIPLILLIWSLFKRNEAVNRLLIIYWRVASLLIITVYLMIPGWGIGYITSIAARILIPISLWFWADINEEIKDMPQKNLKLALTSWRWAIALYCIVGAIVGATFINCAFSNGLFAMPSSSSCQVWLEAPKAFRDFFHAKPNNEGFLGFLGIIGLIAYALYLFYFVLIRLGRQGRSALEQ